MHPAVVQFPAAQVCYDPRKKDGDFPPCIVERTPAFVDAGSILSVYVNCEDTGVPGNPAVVTRVTGVVLAAHAGVPGGNLTRSECVVRIATAITENGLIRVLSARINLDCLVSNPPAADHDTMHPRGTWWHIVDTGSNHPCLLETWLGETPGESRRNKMTWMTAFSSALAGRDIDLATARFVTENPGIMGHIDAEVHAASIQRDAAPSTNHILKFTAGTRKIVLDLGGKRQVSSLHVYGSCTGSGTEFTCKLIIRRGQGAAPARSKATVRLTQTNLAVTELKVPVVAAHIIVTATGPISEGQLRLGVGYSAAGGDDAPGTRTYTHGLLTAFASFFFFFLVGVAHTCRARGAPSHRALRAFSPHLSHAGVLRSPGATGVFPNFPRDFYLTCTL